MIEIKKVEGSLIDRNYEIWDVLPIKIDKIGEGGCIIGNNYEIREMLIL